MGDFAQLLAMRIEEGLRGRKERLFGFEYEFIADRALTVDDLARVQTLLEDLGYSRKPGLFQGTDHYITFEPGGQIEYCSRPLAPRDQEGVLAILDRAREVNRAVEKRLGFRYLPVGYMPGRADAPLLLPQPRYRNLHELLRRTGTRGHEMMKGTAAIHLHAGLMGLDELPGMWAAVCMMSRTPEFAMGTERRHIWDHTDPSRCGLLCQGEETARATPDEFLQRMTDFSMDALDLSTGRPFGSLGVTDLDTFLNHLTTLFTDVRINMKGITLELRTLDSMPPRDFLQRWNTFLDRMAGGDP